jgi:hypothetical protein
MWWPEYVLLARNPIRLNRSRRFIRKSEVGYASRLRGSLRLRPTLACSLYIFDCINHNCRGPSKATMSPWILLYASGMLRLVRSVCASCFISDFWRTK